MGLQLKPISLKEAARFIRAVHRHHGPPVGGKFAVGAVLDGGLVGVVVVGRPVARWLDDGYTAEVTRLASSGERNVCSLLYRAAWRAAKGMGYVRVVTYTLAEEEGGSLRAAGFRRVGECGGGSWSRALRPRADVSPIGRKVRWEIP